MEISFQKFEYVITIKKKKKLSNERHSFQKWSKTMRSEAATDLNLVVATIW